MVRNKQNTYIKKAFFAATKINKDGSHTTYLAPLAENLKSIKYLSMFLESGCQIEIEDLVVNSLKNI